MKKARFTESQIVAILKEADAGIPVGNVIRKHGISSASYYKWKAKYGGLDASELKRIKELEGQLAEFKQIVADLTLENKAMKGLITNSFFRQPESEKRWITWLAKRSSRSPEPAVAWACLGRLITASPWIRRSGMRRWWRCSIRS